MVDFAWVLPLNALVFVVIVGLLVRPVSGWLAGVAGTAGAFINAGLALAIAYGYLRSGTQAQIVVAQFEWLRFQPGLAVNAGVLVDPIAVMLMVVVTSVSALVHLYSIGYMEGERGLGRYFTYLSLFTFSMLGLVVAPNLVQTFVCWELVGASSFLLIGFYYDRPSAVAASKKAFIVTRFADLGFLLGVLTFGFYGYRLYLTLVHGGAAPAGLAFDYAFLNHPATLARLASTPAVGDLSVLAVATLLIFAGAAGKSAMFPLHIWLPDAMEGPTPVSALIHAATMVVAGVYLVARLYPAFAAAGVTLDVVLYVGAFTCVFAAVIACVQNDIKRVLAYSTLSQLGYMMFALGTATQAGYGASMFHLFTHAFFKALLFLGAGAVIHAVHTNDMERMGGLRRMMPLTHASFLVATLAIAGIWPLAGFFSKDEILAAALDAGHPGVYAVGLGVAALTAFYMFRLYFRVFWGTSRSHAGHAHEAPAIMLAPLLVLAALSAVAGFAGVTPFVTGLAGHHGVRLDVAAPATLAAFAGIAAAGYLYAGAPRSLPAFVPALRAAIGRKLFVDEAYLWVTRSVVFRFVAAPIARFDRGVVDGAVNLAARTTEQAGARVADTQTGQVQTYGLWLTVGAVAAVLVVWSVMNP